MSTIRKRGNKWQVQVRRKDCPPVSKTFHKRTDATEWARHMELRADRNDIEPMTGLEAQNATLREMMTKYDCEVVSKKPSANVQSRIVNAFLKNPICDKKALEVTAADLTKYKEERLKEVSATTFNHQMGIIQHAFEVAIREWSWPLKENPVKRLKKPKNDKGRERRVSTEEELTLLKTCEKLRNPHLKNILLFAIQTGMRQGEILRLEWADINTPTRTLHIPITKNGHSRTIPLTPKAVELLSEIRKATGETRVFPLSKEAIKQCWKRLTTKAGIVDLHFHDLRHEAISRFFEMGLSVPEVALISGHRDYRMLFRYTHLKPENIVEKLR